jgi:hypothetical protein
MLTVSLNSRRRFVLTETFNSGTPFITSRQFAVTDTSVWGVICKHSAALLSARHEMSPEVDGRNGRVAVHMRTVLLLNTDSGTDTADVEPCRSLPNFASLLCR